MSDSSKPILGITLGDPSGIGPEIVVKSLTDARVYGRCRPLVIGQVESVKHTIRWLGSSLKVNPVARPEHGVYRHGVVDVLDPVPAHQDIEYPPGTVTHHSGEAAFQSVKTAIELAMEGVIAGTVTAPINKEAINLAGHHYAGHTEIYAELTGTRDYCMMLSHEHFRVAHVSTHVSLRVACDRVTKARVIAVIELVNDALIRMGIAKPRIAVAGLNPHAGEGGLFGYEEIAEIIPALNDVRQKGIHAEGPFPPDTIFPKLKARFHDIVICMYHDQGHIPTKLLGFDYDVEQKKWHSVSGINITLGLPIIRTSVDHGTAFDIAGKGIANEKSMLDAIFHAADLAGTTVARGL